MSFAVRPPFSGNGASLTVSTVVENYNLFTAFGSPTVAGSYTLTLTSSGIIGGTGSNDALTIGQFPSGSVITIEVFGNIWGAPGPAGGVGGDCIYANYPNQSVVINVHTNAQVYAGGGGGGTGGAGGTGGTGGQGQTSSTTSQGPFYTQTAPAYYVYDEVTNGNVHSYQFVWNGTTVANFQTSTTVSPGDGWTYTAGALKTSNTTDPADKFYWYEISRSQTVYTYYPGGAGGTGGAGGGGGVGQGYSTGGVGHVQNNTSGSVGASGSAGAAGGTNAGSGGAGGTGGTGGNGGTWGNAGTAGATGATGQTGNAGNYTAGSAGSAGSAGAAGAAAGNYLIKGASNVTLNNNGGFLAGGLA